MGLTDEQIEKLKLVSEEVTTVMGATPRWIVRWGNLLILICTLLLLALAWLIRYPDMVQGRVKFNGNNIAVIKPQQEGVVKSLVKDGQPVKKGDMLFTLQTDAVDSLTAPVTYTAPANGRVKLLNSLTGNKPYVARNEAVLAVVPDNEKHLKKVVVTISFSDLTKVQLGQKALINLDNYPVQEYGSLTGVVEAISPVPVKDYCEVTVRLNSLSTSFNKKPDVSLSSYTGTARIVTKERRILQRIFSAF